jgi:hypothetical protein
VRLETIERLEIVDVGVVVLVLAGLQNDDVLSMLVQQIGQRDARGSGANDDIVMSLFGSHAIPPFDAIAPR